LAQDQKNSNATTLRIFLFTEVSIFKSIIVISYLSKSKINQNQNQKPKNSVSQFPRHIATQENIEVINEKIYNS